MAEKLSLLIAVALPCLGVYFLSMRLTPHRGLLRVCEKAVIGIVVIYVLNLVLLPFSVSLAPNPLASLATGYLGFPGAALAFVMQNLK